MNKNIKGIVDIFMVIAVALSYIRWDGDPTNHIIVGVICGLLFSFHFGLNKKMHIALCKASRSKKLNGSAKRKHLIDMLLLVVWFVVFISGFLAIGYYVGAMESMRTFSRIHGVSSRLGGVLILAHIVQHKNQLLSYFKTRMKN